MHDTSPKPRVLVVDDDPGVLSSLQMLLEDDCEVVVSERPAEALTLAAAGGFDVIITDFRMPQMNGAEFARALRAQVQPTPYTMLLTGTPNEVRPSTPGAEDLVMVIAKPFEPERVLRLVLQVGRLGLNRRLAVA